MDKLARYRTVIKQILTGYLEMVRRNPEPGEIETDVVFDEERDHYMLVNVGWFRQERWRGATVYLRLRHGKIWVEEDWLEDGIAKDLITAGVPREDIVLGFQPPEMRPYTDFASG